MNNAELVALARAVAARHGLDAALVCAIVEQESGWDPLAVRYEPAFFNKYASQLYINNKVDLTEAKLRSFSWGLGQVMGETAREHGFTGPLVGLCQPELGLELLCRVYAHKAAITSGNRQAALLAYNGGRDAGYPGEVLARLEKYQSAETADPSL